MTLRIRTYTLTSGKMPPIVGGLLVVGVGALLVALGLTLLAGLAVVGTAAAVGVIGYRTLRGSVNRALGRSEPAQRVDPLLDPSKEVFPPTKQISDESK